MSKKYPLLGKVLGITMQDREWADKIIGKTVHLRAAKTGTGYRSAPKDDPTDNGISWDFRIDEIELIPQQKPKNYPLYGKVLEFFARDGDYKNKIIGSYMHFKDIGKCPCGCGAEKYKSRPKDDPTGGLPHCSWAFQEYQIEFEKEK